MRIMSHFTNDAVYHNIPVGPVSGTTAIRDVMQGFMGMASKVDWELRASAETADGVVLTERVDRFLINGKWVALPVMGTFEVSERQDHGMARLLRHEPVSIAARGVMSWRTRVESEVTGSVWKVVVEVGEHVSAGDVLIILESMKMEIPLESPVCGARRRSCSCVRRMPSRKVRCSSSSSACVLSLSDGVCQTLVELQRNPRGNHVRTRNDYKNRRRRRRPAESARQVQRAERGDVRCDHRSR